MGTIPQAITSIWSRADRMPAWVQEIHQQGRAHFEKIGFPSPKDEDWRYTDIRGVWDHTYHGDGDHTKVMGLERPFDMAFSTEVVLINGRFSDSLSTVNNQCSGVSTASLATILSADQPTKLPIMTPSGSALVSLNQSMLREGVLITVAPDVHFEEVIHILHFSSGTTPFLNTPRVIINVQTGSRVQVIETFFSLSETPYWTNTVTEIALAPGAMVDYLKILEEGPSAHHTATTRIHQNRDAVSRAVVLSSGGKVSRSDVVVDLVESGARAIVDGAYLSKDIQLMAFCTDIAHQAPHTSSDQLFKGIINDKARGVFNGRVSVAKHAVRTNSYQLNKNLLLSNAAEVDTKPELCIHADDVKCTHGATIGQIQPDELFYLLSRGISKAQATQMICDGFLFEVANRMPEGRMRQVAECFLQKALCRYFEEPIQ